MSKFLNKNKKSFSCILITIFFTSILFPVVFSYESPESNPVVKYIVGEDRYPDFDVIKPYDYISGMHYIASLEKGEIEKIINKKETPNFHNTIKPLAKNTYLKDLLGLAYFSNKIYSDPLTFAIYDDINSLSDKISLELFNNEKMKEKIKYIWENEDRSKLTYEEIIILENYYYNIYKENEREEILNINRELSKIHNDFIDNLYTQMGGVKMILPDEGLIKPEEEKYFRDYEFFDEKGERYWEFDYGSIPLVSDIASSKVLREKAVKVFNSTGILEGYPDNREILREGINLRLYLAQLEGYDTFAGLTFARSPYINKEKIDQIFLEVNDSIIQSVEKYWDEVEEYSFETEGVRDIDFTDSRYYEGNYNFSPEIKNLYLHEHDKIFEFESVCEAVFELFDNLYGLKFEKDNSIPVPRENIQGYRLIDNGKDLGIIYFDFFYREEKGSAAYVLEFNRGEDKFLHFATSFSENNYNGKTTLSITDISVFLHEMGHLVHSFLSQTEYSGYSGLNYSDVFLELPSQLHELYAWEPEFINKIISKTKDEDLFKEYDNIEKRVIRVRDMAYPKKIHITYFVSKLDQDFFSIKEPLESSILEFEQNSIGDILIHNPGDELGYSYQVPHLVAPGYASAYYTYLISEIMGFDAFQKFQEAGLFNKEAAEKFRKEFLSKGPTEDIEQLYINFMGHPLSTAGIINYLDSIDFKE